MNNHIFCIIIVCTVPLLLIFLLPVFGITGNYSFVIFIVAMFTCHLLIPMHHGGHEGRNDINQTPKIVNHGSHQH